MACIIIVDSRLQDVSIDTVYNCFGQIELGQLFKICREWEAEVNGTRIDC